MIEYLICTRINAEGPSQQLSSPLLGFRIAEQPCFLIALSLNGEITSLPLTSTTLLRKTNVPTISAISDENDAQVGGIVKEIAICRYYKKFGKKIVSKGRTDFMT